MSGPWLEADHNRTYLRKHTRIILEYIFPYGGPSSAIFRFRALRCAVLRWATAAELQYLNCQIFTRIECGRPDQHSRALKFLVPHALVNPFGNPAMQSMTLAKALIELKLLDKQILQRINELNPVAVKQNNKLLNTKLTQSEFEREAKACWQDLRNLTERRRRIKCALFIANATTKVTVAKKAYTLAEAIEHKRMMEVEKRIISETWVKLSFTKASLDAIERHNEEKLMRLLESMYGGAEKARQPSAADHEAVAAPFKKNKDVVLVDPLDCEKLLQSLEAETDSFLAEVDVCMSVANATTVINLS